MDWGLGHASRMVPIIELLIHKKHKVIIGADQRPLAFLKGRFPDCEFIQVPGYQPSYPGKGSMAMKLLSDLPLMMRAARKAKKLLELIIDEKAIDIVISDNRYELSSTKAQCILLPVGRFVIRHFIKKFDALWIPDFEGQPNLSGKLSHIKHFPLSKTYFIGPLSRFVEDKEHFETESIDLLVIMSGPEPQRSYLEELLISQLKETDLKSIILQGKPETHQSQTIANISLVSHADDETMAAMIRSAGAIISRPGYSTLMDLGGFHKKVIFIPTPGQTEQEYLATKIKNEGCCVVQKQADFILTDALDKLDNVNAFSFPKDPSLLESALTDILL